MALFHTRMKSIGRTTHTTVGALAYRAGVLLKDERTGEVYNYRNKSVAHVELILPENAPQWAKDLRDLIVEDKEKGLQAFSDLLEASEKRKDARVYKEFEFALQREFTDEKNLVLAQQFVQDFIARRGIGGLVNYHIDVDQETGEKKPHIHLMMVTRYLEKEGLGLKNTEIDKEEFLKDLRQELKDLTNFHLKLEGHTVRVDHRSYAERGIDLLPQPKMRRGVWEMERREGFEGRSDSLSALTHRFMTRVGQDWQSKRLHNLFQLNLRPETLLEVVASKQSTFVWKDVREEVSRHIPDRSLAHQLESRILSSGELVQIGDHRFFEGTADERAVPVLSTKATLSQEREVSRLAQRLEERSSHEVESSLVEERLRVADETLKEKHGTGLSGDQKAALHHLCSPSALSCVVGYAGAGKSTVVGVAANIWTTSGYRVYGLAPTGRAAAGLQEAGLTSSQTLHRFLHSFEAGQCHYDQRSVLVLDEGGMVPVHLMKRFLHAVNDLGVKAVIVGDGNQLQPIEAGAAFRSVLKASSPASLETVVRQKVDWQREATVAFGQGKAAQALSLYADQGHLHLKSGLSSLLELRGNLEHKDAEVREQAEVDLYRLRDTARLLKDQGFGQLLEDIERQTGKRDWRLAMGHSDLESRYGQWKQLEKDCRDALQEAGFSPHRPTQEVLSQYGRSAEASLMDVRSGARSALLEAWRTFVSQSGSADPEKLLMLSYSRKDVQALNEGARAFLQREGHVSLEERVHEVSRPYKDAFGRDQQEVSERAFAPGDVIVFLKNDRGVGVHNGNRGRVVGVDSQRLQVELFGDEKKTVSFATNLYNAVDYGWATTIHKAQGETVDKTLVLASPFDHRNLAYVALSRHREDVQVFGSTEEFGDEKGLVQSLSRVEEKLLGQDYLQEGEERVLEPSGRLSRLKSRVEGLKSFLGQLKSEAQELRDPTSLASLKSTPSAQVATDLCSRVLDLWSLKETRAYETQAQDLLEVVGRVREANPEGWGLFKEGYQEQAKTVFRLEKRFKASPAPLPEVPSWKTKDFSGLDPLSGSSYERREGARGREILEGSSSPRPSSASLVERTRVPGVKPEGNSSEKGSQDKLLRPLKAQSAPKPREHIDVTLLNQELASRATDLSRTLLGDPNKGLSSTRELRFGKKGSLCMTVQGQNAGRWYDFEKAEGGTLLTLIQEQKGLSFKDALTFGNEFVGGRATTAAPPLSSLQSSHSLSRQEEDERKAKIEMAQKTYDQSKALENHQFKYLLTRGVYEFESGDSLRSGWACVSETQDLVPCLIAFAKNKDGQITGGQKILLNPETGRKHEAEVNKRSFGVIKGSFVTLQEDTSKTGRTFMAEGVETALSIKKAGFKGKVVATLGVHNFKNYTPTEKEHTVVLCGDNDGENAPSHKILQETRSLLEEKGCTVRMVRPNQKGQDFNDVLKKEGLGGVQKILEKRGIPLTSGPERNAPRPSQEVQEVEVVSKEETLDKQAEPQSVEPKDWYKELKEMDYAHNFTEKLSSLVQDSHDPQKQETAKAEIQGLLTTAAEDRQFSRFIASANDNPRLFIDLYKQGIDLRQYTDMSRRCRLTLSPRQQEELVNCGLKVPPSSLEHQFKEQLKLVNQEGTLSPLEKEMRISSAQEICAVLIGIQSRLDKEDILSQEKWSNALECLEKLGREEKILKEEVARALSQDIEKENERDRGFGRDFGFER